MTRRREKIRTKKYRRIFISLDGLSLSFTFLVRFIGKRDSVTSLIDIQRLPTVNSEEPILYKPVLLKPEEMDGRANMILRVLPTSGFHVVESRSGIQTRWMQDNATLAIFSPDSRTVSLSFWASSFRHPRTIEILVENNIAARRTAPTDWVSVAAPIKLELGGNAVQLRVCDGCERPRDIADLNSPDPRCLSIAIQDIEIFEHNSSAPIVSLSKGFNPLESWSGIKTFWMQPDAELAVTSSGNRTAKLSMRAQSFSRPRTIEVIVGVETNAM